MIMHNKRHEAIVYFLFLRTNALRYSLTTVCVVKRFEVLRGYYTGVPINENKKGGVKQNIKYYQTFDSFIIARCLQPARHVYTQVKQIKFLSWQHVRSRWPFTPIRPVGIDIYMQRHRIRYYTKHSTR